MPSKKISSINRKATDRLKYSVRNPCAESTAEIGVLLGNNPTTIHNVTHYIIGQLGIQ